MDNFHFDMTSEGAGQLKAALSLFSPPGRKVEGYRVDPDKGLILYWHVDQQPKSGLVKLPFKMTLDQAADFATGWLAEQDYGREPDHDGDNGKGWRLYCETWGTVGGESYAFAAVKPVWAMYGK